MPHVFGKALKLSFTPLADNDPISVGSLVSARLFRNQPNGTQLQTPATPGFISEVTFWTAGTDFEKIITFPAVTDASPTSTNDYEQYWVAINYTQETNGQTVFSLEPILIFRPDGITSAISTTATDVLGVEPKLSNNYITAQLNSFIADAKKDIFRWYKGLNFPRKDLINIDELNDACRYRAAAKACLSLYTSAAPEWLEKFKEYNGSYHDTLKSSQPLADIGGDGDPIKTPSWSTAYLTR